MTFHINARVAWHDIIGHLAGLRSVMQAFADVRPSATLVTAG